MNSTPSRMGRKLILIFLVFGGLLLPLALMEIVIRIEYPFLQDVWPSEFHPNIGWIFKPGAVLKHTNYQDYAVIQTINSLGFPDREPLKGPPQPNDYRILILGDSYIEAAQVELKDKLPAQLEAVLAPKFPNRRFLINAMGYSGSGTTNVLPFYTEIGRTLKPNLVIISFVNNDFANNSPLLESIRNGWDPYHPPRLFYEIDGDKYRDVPIDPDWNSHILPVKAPESPKPALDRFLDWSFAYVWLSKRISLQKATTDAFDLYAKRLEYLRLTPEYAERLEGWNYPEDLDFDNMFYANDMPKVFKEAIDITGHTFAQFKKLGEEDHFDLLVVASDGCSLEPPPSKASRIGVSRGYFLHLEEVARSVGVKVHDLKPYFSKKGTYEQSRFAHDGHWNSTGHRWAAESIGEYIVEHSDELHLSQ